MAIINPKLNLNRTPSIVENNSLVFAKNVRVDVDNSIHKDYSISPLSVIPTKKTDNGIQLFNDYANVLGHAINDFKKYIEENPYAENIDSYKYYLQEYIKLNTKNTYRWRIIDVIPSNTEFYIFIYGNYKEGDSVIRRSLILRYDEKTSTYSPCDCNWNWSGGKLTGCVINNLVGDKLIIVGESKPTSKDLVPLKCINLNNSSREDDETKYTQTPNIPYTNLTYGGRFAHTVPNGVYQFFVRYKIRDNFYTDWFPASRDIFIGNKYNTSTTFGTVQYVNTNLDSDNSVILDVEHVLKNNIKNYKTFQVGYILSHDDAVLGRAWKHFDIDTTKIYFDFKEEDIEEIDVTDFTKTTYQLYNVGNITNFKNKLYISNYTETDFNDNNPDLKKAANAIKINIKETDKQEGKITYAGYEADTYNIDNETYITSIKVHDDSSKNLINGNVGLINEILNTTGDDKIKATLFKVFSEDESIYSDAKANANNFNYGIQIDSQSNDTYNSSRGSKERELNSKLLKDNSSDYLKDSDNLDKIRMIEFKDPNDAEILLNYNDNEEISYNKNEYNENIVDTIFNYIKSQIYYMDLKGSFVNNKFDYIKQFNIVIRRKVTYQQLKIKGGVKPVYKSTNNNDLGFKDTGLSDIELEWKNIEDTYDQTIIIKVYGSKSLVNVPDVKLVSNCTTLIPHQTYRFYIHFIRNNGEVSNGYYCSGAKEITVKHYPDCEQIIYPEFSDITIPNGYVGCFFSLLHVKNRVSTIANLKDYTYKETNETLHYIGIEGIDFDINTMLIPMFNEFPIKATSNTGEVCNATGQFHYSGNSNVVRYFGADGVISVESDYDIATPYVAPETNNLLPNGKIAYAIDKFEASDKDEDNYLLKCTSYYSKEYIEEYKVIKDYQNYELKGYICTVYPLSREVSTELYTDGSTLTYKENPYVINSTDYKFREVSQYESRNNYKTLLHYPLINTNPVNVYSNFNLNYLALTEEPKIKITSYYSKFQGATSSSSSSGSTNDNTNTDTNDTTTDNNTSSGTNTDDDSARNDEKNTHKFLLRLFSSLILSSVYTLPKMYKEYTRKNYYIKQDNVATRFDNTIRSSMLQGDEETIEIFKFDANDYYNVPPDKGKIVNLVGVGDMIIAHTEDTMFRFTGSNSLSANEGEIKTKEGEPFDTGIAEIFGSDFGFAGIQNKDHSILSENGYIFFDKDANVIYIYSGQGQISKITEPIEKLMRYDKVSNVYFANDYYNNRFFVNIVFENGEHTNLSFCVHPNIKSFVSLHDFNFVKAFNTKTNCYFIGSEAIGITNRPNRIISKIDKTSTGFYGNLLSSSGKLYPYKEDSIEIGYEEPNTGSISLTTRKIAYSFIDVIVNQNYEIVKTLNSITWCSRFVKSEFAKIDNNNLDTLKMADVIEDKLPCFGIRIYTDTCMTPLMNFDFNSNDFSINNPNSYKYPKYNQGKFTLNYFRNIQNTRDIFNYLPKYDDGRGGQSKTPDYRSDNNSLVEGKYFVVRFLFDKDFKLETLDLNYNNKL